MSPEVEQLWKDIHSTKVEKALTHIFDITNDWLYAGKFDLLNEMLILDPAKEEAEITLAFLVISRWAIDKMPNRPALFEAAKKHFEHTRPDEAHALLQGLEP